MVKDWRNWLAIGLQAEMTVAVQVTLDGIGVRCRRNRRMLRCGDNQNNDESK
jgi:hypothetical protein